MRQPNGGRRKMLKTACGTQFVMERKVMTSLSVKNNFMASRQNDRKETQRPYQFTSRTGSHQNLPARTWKLYFPRFYQLKVSYLGLAVNRDE